MSLQNQNSKVLWYFFIFLWFILLLLFARPAYNTNIEKKADISWKQTTLNEKNNQLSALNDMKLKVEQAKKWNGEFARFSKEFDANEIFKHFYAFQEKSNTVSSYRFKIKSLRISEPEATEMWMNKVTINLEADFYSKEWIISLIDYMTKVWNDYSFYITKVDLQDFSKNTSDWNLSVSLPFIFFYK